MPEYSIVVPVFNSQEVLPLLLRELQEEMAEHGSYEILFIDDCSVDNSWEVLKKMKADSSVVRLFRLANNVGQANATLCGIYNSTGKTIITIDDDLQYPPREITKLITRYKKGDAYMVIGLTEGRSRTFFTGIMVKLVKLFFKLWPVNYINGRQISSSFRIFGNHFNHFPNASFDRVHSIHIATLSFDPRFVASVYVEHNTQTFRKTNYNIRKRTAGFLDMWMTFNPHPFKSLKWLIVFLMVFWIFVIAQILIKGESTLYTIPVLGLCITTGLLMLMVMGAYVGKLLSLALGRPPYLVMEKID